MSKPCTIVDKVPQPSGPAKTLPKSRERHPYDMLNPDDINREKLDPADVSRLLQKVQEGGRDATLPARTDPTIGGEIHCNITLANNTVINIAHGLGEPARYYHSLGAWPGSQPFAAVRANTKLSPSKYLVLLPSCNGTYDIKITPG